MIDRIVDGAMAVLLLGEEQTQVLVPVETLPVGSAEGLWLLIRIEDGVVIEAELDDEKTEEIRGRIQAKRALLLQRMARRGR